MAEYDDGVSAAINRRRREGSKVRDGGIVVRHAPLILISEREIIRRSYLFIHIHETFPKFIYEPRFFFIGSRKKLQWFYSKLPVANAKRFFGQPYTKVNVILISMY
jgi:hypothetical protein